MTRGTDQRAAALLRRGRPPADVPPPLPHPPGSGEDSAPVSAVGVRGSLAIIGMGAFDSSADQF